MRRFRFLGSLTTIAALAACAGPNPCSIPGQEAACGAQQRSAQVIGGAVAGAGLGALIGHFAGHHAGEGAAIGAGVGALGGAIAPIPEPSYAVRGQPTRFGVQGQPCAANATGAIGTTENLPGLQQGGYVYARQACVAPNGQILAIEQRPIGQVQSAYHPDAQPYQAPAYQQPYVPSYAQSGASMPIQ